MTPHHTSQIPTSAIITRQTCRIVRHLQLDLEVKGRDCRNIKFCYSNTAVKCKITRQVTVRDGRKALKW
jgi:ribosomal protein S27E